MPRRRSLSRCAVKPRMDDPSKVRLSQLLIRNFRSETEDIRRSAVKRAPVDAQAQIALALRSEAADGRSVEGEVVPAVDQELLVVVEHVQPAFEIAEEHGHG